MTARRLRLVVAGLAVVAVVALTWFLGVGPLLGQAATTEAQLTATAAVNEAQAARLTALAADARTLPALQARLGTADAALPAKPELAAFFQELGELQERHEVTVTNYTGAAAVSAGTAQSAPAAGTAATPAPSAAPATSPSAPATPAPATGLTRIPMQLQVTGSYRNLVAFVGGLQTGRRLFLVDTVAITAGTTGSGFSAAVSGSVYVLPAVTAG